MTATDAATNTDAAASGTTGTPGTTDPPGTTDRPETTGSPPDLPRTRLSPAARLLWRGTHTVQLELGTRAMLVEGIDAAGVARLVGRGPALEPDAAHPALVRLTEHGYLVRPDRPWVPPAPRLASELTALAARWHGNAASVLQARNERCVVVNGDGRVAAQVAALLAAAGVGRVTMRANGSARLAHTLPGGVTPADEGHALNRVGASATQRAAPEVQTLPLPVGERPDLVVLAYDRPVDSERSTALRSDGLAHLAVSVGVDHGVVGPLVLPGLSACLRCTDLHRLDRDPAWDALAVQLSIRRQRPPASPVCLASLIGSLAALQSLAFLDGDELAVIDGTLEVELPDWQVRRRSWPMHPGCECAA